MSKESEKQKRKPAKKAADQPYDCMGVLLAVGDRVEATPMYSEKKPPITGEVIAVLDKRVEVKHDGGYTWRAAAFLWKKV